MNVKNVSFFLQLFHLHDCIVANQKMEINLSLIKRVG